jgi:hypothetical protein
VSGSYYIVLNIQVVPHARKRTEEFWRLCDNRYSYIYLCFHSQYGGNEGFSRTEYVRSLLLTTDSILNTDKLIRDRVCIQKSSENVYLGHFRQCKSPRVGILLHYFDLKCQNDKCLINAWRGGGGGGEGTHGLINWEINIVFFENYTAGSDPTSVTLHATHCILARYNKT